MSTGGGDDQVKKRAVGLWATPPTDWGGDDGAARKKKAVKLLHYIYPTCTNAWYIPDCRVLRVTG